MQYVEFERYSFLVSVFDVRVLKNWIEMTLLSYLHQPTFQYCTKQCNEIYDMALNLKITISIRREVNFCAVFILISRCVCFYCMFQSICKVCALHCCATLVTEDNKWIYCSELRNCLFVLVSKIYWLNIIAIYVTLNKSDNKITYSFPPHINIFL